MIPILRRSFLEQHERFAYADNGNFARQNRIGTPQLGSYVQIGVFRPAKAFVIFVAQEYREFISYSEFPADALADCFRFDRIRPSGGESRLRIDGQGCTERNGAVSHLLPCNEVDWASDWPREIERDVLGSSTKPRSILL